MPTILEIAQGRSTPLTQGLMETVRTSVPLLSAFDARTSSDDRFLSLALVSLPTSRFVGVNEGLQAGNAGFELREFSCSQIGGLVMAEVEAARLWDARHTGVGMTWLEIQIMARLKADMRHVEKQMIQGRANDAKGFPGAKEMTPFSASNVLAAGGDAQASEFKRSVINAGGTTASTASSVYSFVFGEMESQLVVGNDTGAELLTVGQTIRQMMAPDSTKPTQLSEHDALEVRGYLGLSVSGFNIQESGQAVPTQYSLRRICNLTADSGKGLTDSLMEQLVLSHGEGRTPGVFAMSNRSGLQLATSRAPTQINFMMGSGDAARSTFSTQPSRPDNWQGIPIAYSDAVGSTDAIES